ncbi:MAG: AIR synthase-related protein, partial [Eubacterium sp.]
LELLTPTRIYVKPLLALMDKINVNAISHITGGGFYENVPRMLKDGFTAVIEKDKCFKKPIFDLIAKEGNIPERDMYNTFNMGTGLVIAVDSDKADEAVEILKANGEEASVIGQIKSGEKGVELV